MFPDLSFKLPSYDDIHENRRGHRYGYMQFYEKMTEWAQKNTAALKRIESLESEELDEFRRIFKDVSELFIVDYSGWATLQVISEKEPIRNLDELEKRLKAVSLAGPDETGATDDTGVIRYTVASDLLVELSRTHFILMHRQMVHESSMISRLNSIPNGKDYDVLWSLEHGNFFSLAGTPLEKKPIMSFSQGEIATLLFHLTERLDCVTTDAIEELRHIVKLVYTRNSIFFCQRMPIATILDFPRGRTPENTPTREYKVFCSIYFHTIQRRLFLYDVCTRKKVPTNKELTDSVARFIEQDIKLGSETFEEEYKKACEEAYAFPGDLEWFKYQNPDMPPQTGPILDCYRKDMAKRYYMNHRITQDVVMAAVQQPTHSGHAARIFILNILGQYLKIHYKIPWVDTVVIKNSAMVDVKNEKKLFSKKSAPFLVQVCSRMWVYCDKVVYVTDNIYEALGYWMYLLKDRYGGKLFNVNLNEFIYRIGIR